MEDKYKGLKAFLRPAVFAMIMWIVFLAAIIFRLDLHEWGVFPRTLDGIIGILTSPFIHSDLNHIASNTVPLLVVGTGLFYFYKAIAWRVFIMIYLLTGFWVWLAARPNFHIGASGLIYGLVCFMFFSGLLGKDRRLLAISLLVTFLYGSMVWGILPVDQSVSWESHLFGSAAGIFAAVYYRKEGPEKEKYSWELEEEEEMKHIDQDQEVPTDPEGGIIVHYHFKESSSGDDEDKKSES